MIQEPDYTAQWQELRRRIRTFFVCWVGGFVAVGILLNVILVLWDCEFGATLLPPQLLSLAPDALVFTQCYHPDDLPALLPQIQERSEQRQPERSFLLNVEDTMLRLQVGADGFEMSYAYDYLDIPVTPGVKRCDVYLFQHESIPEEVVIIDADR